MGLDIGPQTVADFIARNRARAKTVIWNGPLGFFEIPAFARRYDARGRGDRQQGGRHLDNRRRRYTAAAVAQRRGPKKFTHISTGGGATLEYLEGRELPGVKALEA